jgi:hypothetical protein
MVVGCVCSRGKASCLLQQYLPSPHLPISTFFLQFFHHGLLQHVLCCCALLVCAGGGVY